MPTPPYRKASRFTGVWLLIFVAGIAGELLTMAAIFAMDWEKTMGPWILIISAIPFAIAIISAVAMTKRLNRKRITQVTDKLRALGFQVNPSPNDAQKKSFGVPLEPLMHAFGFKTGSAGIQWYAEEGSGSARTLCVEHEYITGSGKNAQVHNHTVVIWPAAHPALRRPNLATGPEVLLARSSWLVRRLHRKSELTDPAFSDLAATWAIFGNAEAAKQFLTPELRQRLTTSPRGEQWHLGQGTIACACEATLDSENIGRFLNHARQIGSA